MRKNFEIQLNDKLLTVELNKYALQSENSCMIRYGNTTVLATLNTQPTNGVDFLPLTVIFQEKLYSVGKIPGSFQKREGKPSEFAIATGRLIDRAIRPLFPKGYNNEVQINLSALSVENKTDARFAAFIGAMVVLSLSKINLLSTASMFYSSSKNNNTSDCDVNSNDIFIVTTNDKIVMIEAFVNELKEKDFLHIVKNAFSFNKTIINFINEICKGNDVQKESLQIKSNVVQNDFSDVKQEFIKSVNEIILSKKNNDKQQSVLNLITKTINNFSITNNQVNLEALRNILLNEFKILYRENILKNKIRLDNRKLTEIRELAAEIDNIPLVHGSGLFNRGKTQVLSLLTLGALDENQIIDGITDVDNKKFMHHYNFAPFSIGAVGKYNGVSRREIGHGLFGENVLVKVLPSVDEFPYTIRLVSEVLASDGSTSQAAICASILALMAGGVPIKKIVSGLAFGLIYDNESKYEILTDISGMEDHLGDMDFKIARSNDGIFGIQMDLKIPGITLELFEDILQRTGKSLKKVIDVIKKTIKTPRIELAENVSKHMILTIPNNMIKVLIGTGGKTITNIIKNNDDVKIDINESGKVIIYHQNLETIKQAIEDIQKVIKTYKIGDSINGVVKKIVDFGIFVKIDNNIEALLHKSKIFKASNLDNINIEDYFKLEQKIKTNIIEIDNKNRIKLELTKKI